MKTLKSAIVIAGLLALMLTLSSNVMAVIQKDEEKSLAEFKDYAAKRLGDLTDEQLDKIADAVDKNSDGKISEDEFEDRMEAVQKVMSDDSGETDSDSDTDESKDSKETDPPKAIEVVEVPALVDSTDAPVLLITADELAEAWVPFAKWKTQNGKLTKIVTVGQISQQYKADSIQEKIRLCVREHIDNHKTRWLILGGDSLPDGKGLVPGGHTTVHYMEPEGIPTDIIYLSPTNWDADEDGIYGEFDDDRDAITYPDGTVGLGRIPVRTVEDIIAFTEKVIAYESDYPVDLFAKNMIYTCTDIPGYPKVRNSWDGYVSKVWDGEVGRFFSEETPWDEEDEPGSYDLSPKNFVKLINSSKVGKIHIHGHGHLPGWVLETARFTKRHVRKLTNKGAYPLITTVSCFTGQYDSDEDPSIVERMLRTPNAGSVAIVAPIRTGKPHFAKRSDFRLMVTEGKLDGTTMTMTDYWSFGLGEGASTGHAIMKAKEALADDATTAAAYHLCVCELNLLGDPTLDMRASAPRVPTLTTDSRKVDDGWEISVSTDAPGSTVCIWDQHDVYKVATADKSGNATFTVASAADEFVASVSGGSLNSVSEKFSVEK